MKRGKHCPICNTKNAMIRKVINEKLEIKDFPPLTIKNLEIEECKNCTESFYTTTSKNRIKSEVSIHKAKELAKTTTIDQVITSEELAKQLNVTRQRISAMLKKGQIQFVMNDTGLKLPLRTEIERLKALRK